MKIGDAAKASGLSVKTVRYYADTGLVTPAARGENGYRNYDETTIQKLRFVGRARAFGFSIAECKELLSLYEDRSRASANVKAIAESKIAALDQKLNELKELRDELAHIASACAGDERPSCPILDRFAS